MDINKSWISSMVRAKFAMNKMLTIKRFFRSMDSND